MTTGRPTNKVSGRIARRLEIIRAEWARRLTDEIERKVSDARAHADRVLTVRLRDTPDGRATARVAASSRSFDAALKRLDELLTWLTGPSGASLNGKLREVRDQLYRRAYELHAPLVPEAVRIDLSPTPRSQDIRIVRGYPMHGLDLRDEIGGHVDRARIQLRGILTRAGDSEMTADRQDDLLDAWERQTRDSLSTAVLTALSDSMVWCESEARRDLIAQEYRGQ